MKFKIDENLPVEFAGVLRSSGHDAMTIAEEEMSGIQDVDLFGACQAEERALMTLDLDFGDIRLYPPSQSYGVLVFRIQPQDKFRLLECLQKIVPLIKQEAITKTLWIVEEDRTRIRD